MGLIKVASNGFVDAQSGHPFVPFGVNAIRTNLWADIGSGWEVDWFKQIADTGANVVRIFLSFPDMLESPGKLRADALGKTDLALSLIQENGMRFLVSGPLVLGPKPDWWPGGDDIYSDPVLLEMQEFFWREFAQHYRGAEAVFAYDLRNEPVIPWDSPSMRPLWNAWVERKYGSQSDLERAWGRERLAGTTLGTLWPPTGDDLAGDQQLWDYQCFRDERSVEWVKRLTGAIRGADPTHPITAGLDPSSIPFDRVGARSYHAFDPRVIAPHLDYLAFHWYPFEPLRHGYLFDSPEAFERAIWLLEGSARYAYLGKPVSLEEYGWYGGGAPTWPGIAGGRRYPHRSEEDQVAWNTAAVEQLVGHLNGWLVWLFQDFPEANDISTHMGLVTLDGKPKAWHAAFRRLAARIQENGASPRAAGRATITMNKREVVTSAVGAAAFRQRYLELRREAGPLDFGVEDAASATSASLHK